MEITTTVGESADGAGNAPSCETEVVVEQSVVDSDPGIEAESGNEPSPGVATAADGPPPTGAAGPSGAAAHAADGRTAGASDAIDAGAPDAAGRVRETVFGCHFVGHDLKVQRRPWSEPGLAAQEAWAAGDSVDDSMRLVSPWIKNLSDDELDRMLEVFRRKVRQERRDAEKDP
jgi:hypothetical protein